MGAYYAIKNVFPFEKTGITSRIPPRLPVTAETKLQPRLAGSLLRVVRNRQHHETLYIQRLSTGSDIQRRRHPPQRAGYRLDLFHIPAGTRHLFLQFPLQNQILFIPPGKRQHNIFPTGADHQRATNQTTGSGVQDPIAVLCPPTRCRYE